MNMLEQYKSARRIGTPLMGIMTADPASTMLSVVESTKTDIPIISWNIVDGAVSHNEGGYAALATALGLTELESNDARDTILEKTQEPVNMLTFSRSLPAKSVIFFLNGQLFLPDEHSKNVQVTQAIWLLRDLFKQDKRTLVMLGPHFTLPPELKHDVLILDEPLPGKEELVIIVQEQIESAKKGNWLSNGVSDEQLERAVEAVRGLSAFSAEQSVAMAATKTHLDLDYLWERKRLIIESTPGLSVWREGQRFSDIGGLDAAKNFFNRYIQGRGRPACIAWIDEIEQAMAGVGGDTSGTSQDQLQVMLSEMENNKWTGAILYGQPGSGKSALAKALGNEAGAPTVHFDLGAMKDSLVGGSEKRVREVVKVLKAIGGSQVLFLATSNNFSKLPSQFRDRFKLPIFYFDFPDALNEYKSRVERDTIWKIYLERYEHVGKGKTGWDVRTYIGFDDAGWSGRNIEQACLLAWQLGMKVSDVAGLIITQNDSNREEIDERRREANGKYLSASVVGKYQMPTNKVIAPTKTTRGAFGEE